MPNQTKYLSVTLAGLCALVGNGCGATRYDVLAPNEFHGPLPANAGTPRPKDGIEYELYQADRQAVIVFINRTATPIRLTDVSTLTDATGRSFTIDPQLLAVGQSGRVLLPPAIAAERTTLRSPPPLDTEPHVGGVDEGGFITRDRLAGRETAEAPRGFRWGSSQHATAHLVFEPQSDPSATAPATRPTSTITHDFILSRTR